MQRRRWRKFAGRVLVGIIGLVGLPTVGAGQVAPAAGPFGYGPGDAWDTFDADVTIHPSFETTGGQPLALAPPGLTFRLERQLQPTGWHTSMTLLTVDQPAVAGGQTVDTPFVVQRMEYDDNGSAPRLYDRTGQIIHAPLPSDLADLGGTTEFMATAPQAVTVAQVLSAPPVAPATRTWVQGLIAMPNLAAARRAAIEQRFGQALPPENGLDRYLHGINGATHEMLVAPDAVVPMEINVVRGSVLVSHITMAYTTYAGGVLCRDHIHSEHLVPTSGSILAVTDITLANVTLSKRVGQ